MGKRANEVTGETGEREDEIEVKWFCPVCKFKTPYVKMQTCPTCEMCGATMRTRLEAKPNLS